MDNINKYLLDYDVLYIEKVKTFLESPINFLYSELKKVKKETYFNNQRIVFVDTCPEHSTQYFYQYLEKILVHLDIPNFFILILSNNNQVLKYFPTEDPVTCQIVDLSPEHITDPTNFNIPESVCVLPWTNINVGINGELRFCRLYNRNNIENIKNNSLANYLQRDEYIKLRQDLLNGKKPSVCSNCWDCESLGGTSVRLQYQSTFKDILFDVDWNKTHDTDIITYNINLTNKCNMSCRSCGPVGSTEWVREYKQNPTVYNLTELEEPIEWVADTNSTAWQDFKKVSSKIRYISFAGGEPLLFKPHTALLEYLVETGISKRVKLHYNTNGTIYAEDLFSLWDKFKSVELSFSIDNIGEKFEFERYGGKWENVFLNIKKYQTNTPYILNVYSLVSALNILDRYDLYKFFSKNNIAIQFTPITTVAPEMSPGIFTNKQKDVIISKLTTKDAKFNRLIAPVIEYIQVNSGNLKISDFIKFLEKTDRVRNQDFRQVYPELSKLIKEETAE